ncbi:MAG: hypothetical protein Fur0018_23590 [Anaerolineales bacterium]
MILIGLAAGLFYGWVVNPVSYVDTSPQALHPAYKADYVLMTAEIYRADGDFQAAVQRLQWLGDAPPAEVVQQAIAFATSAGYSSADVQLMQRLMGAFQTPLPSP